MFVKGPFDGRSQKTFSKDTAEMHVFLDSLKPYLGDELHKIGMEIIDLIPGLRKYELLLNRKEV